jgi:predicted nucleic acid-binding protein
MSSTKTNVAEAILVDTSVLLEAVDEARKHHVPARALLEGRARLVFPAQVIREFLVVATRPLSANGLGMEVSDALENIRELRRAVRLLPEEKPLLPRLLALLAEIPCQGKRIHDAHIVAAAEVHRIKTIATLDAEDFSSFVPRVTVVTPAENWRITK